MTSNLVAIGGYRCGCTDLQETMEAIPGMCPIHDRPLYKSPEWVENANDVLLGFEEYTEVQEKQMLIDLIVSSVDETEAEKVKVKPTKQVTLDMGDI